jgi:hypothetical protein
MHTPSTDAQANGGVGGAAKSVAEHASAIARLEVELAALELKKKVATLGIGIGMGVGAALFGIFGLWFVFATIAAGLATFLSTWLALLIVTVFLFLLAGVLALLARGAIKKGTPPVPEQAIREAKLTSEALKR